MFTNYFEALLPLNKKTLISKAFDRLPIIKLIEKSKHKRLQAKKFQDEHNAKKVVNNYNE